MTLVICRKLLFSLPHRAIAVYNKYNETDRRK